MQDDEDQWDDDDADDDSSRTVEVCSRGQFREGGADIEESLHGQRGVRVRTPLCNTACRMLHLLSMHGSMGVEATATLRTIHTCDVARHISAHHSQGVVMSRTAP